MRKIIVITFIAFVLRLISINQSIWLDEASTALVSQKSVSDYFSKFAIGDFHPPLYYLLSIEVAKVFGVSELALRSVSLIAGIITIFFSYKITLRLTDKPTIGLCTALFIATSGLHIYYSQEARMYALAALFATMSVYYYLINNWKVFGISIAAMVMTHYVTVFLLPVFLIYGIGSHLEKNSWKKFILSHVVLLVGFALWFPIFYKQLTAGLGVETSTPLWWNILGKTTLKEMALVPAKFIFGRITVDNDLLYILATGIVGGLFGVIIAKGAPLSDKKINLRNERIVVWLWLFVPTLLTALMGLWVPVFSYFRILFVLPALYIVLGLGIEKMGRRWQMLSFLFIILVNLVSSSVYLFDPRFQREDWKGLVDFISEESGSSDTVLFVNNSQMEAYNYYFDKRIAEVKDCILPFSGCRYPVPSSDPEFVEYGDTIWLMRYVQPIFDPDDTVRNEIEGLGYEKTSEYDFNGVVVWRYEHEQ